MTDDLYGALRRFAQNSKLFSLLDSFGLERLARSGALQHFEPDVTVVRQGDPGDRFYLIIEGEVRVLVEEAGGEVARLAAGNFFGEIGVLTKQPRSATVETVASCEMIAFDREPVLELLEDYPRVKEVVGTVGLLRSEENLDRASAEGDGGLASILEGGDDEAHYDGDDIELDAEDEESDAPEIELDTAEAPAEIPSETSSEVELELDPGEPVAQAAPPPPPPAEDVAEAEEIELDLDFDL